MKQIKVEHVGSLRTKTIFKTEDGNFIKIEVYLSDCVSICNKWTHYNIIIFSKKKGFKSWFKELETGEIKSNEVFEIIGQDILYKSLFNHWQKLNPIRFFSNGSLNGELLNFTVKEIQQDKHFSF